MLKNPKKKKKKKKPFGQVWMKYQKGKIYIFVESHTEESKSQKLRKGMGVKDA